MRMARKGAGAAIYSLLRRRDHQVIGGKLDPSLRIAICRIAQPKIEFRKTNEIHISVCCGTWSTVVNADLDG